MTGPALASFDLGMVNDDDRGAGNDLHVQIFATEQLHFALPDLPVIRRPPDGKLAGNARHAGFVHLPPGVLGPELCLFLFAVVADAIVHLLKGGVAAHPVLDVLHLGL